MCQAGKRAPLFLAFLLLFKRPGCVLFLRGMIKHRTGQFGRVVQVRKPSALLNTIPALIIQTHGIRRKNVATCTTPEKLRSLLLDNLEESAFVVNTICTLEVDKDLVVLFRSLSVLGKDVYLFTYNCDKLWYVDEVL